MFINVGGHFLSGDLLICTLYHNKKEPLFPETITKNFINKIIIFIALFQVKMSTEQPLSTGAQTPGADSIVDPNAIAPTPRKQARPRGKPQPEKPKRSLFCLGLKNPIRKLCYDIVEWKYPFQI